MRILHVLDHSIPLQSGYTFRTLSILREQRRRGWETFHITSPKHTAPYQPSETVSLDGTDWHFYRTSEPSGLFGKLPVLREFAQMSELTKRLNEVVQEIKPDIIHAHSPALNGLPALRVGKKHGIPVVYEVRAFWEDAAVSHGTSKEWGLRYRLTRALETRVLKEADAAACICDGLRQDIIARGIPADKLIIVPNAINLANFPDQRDEPDPELVKGLGLEGKTVIGFVGSFYEYEGLDDLVRAMPKIRDALPNAKLLLVGGGQAEDEIKRLIKENNLEDCTIFTGRVPHDQVKRYYSLIDVLAYPRKSMRLTETVTPLKPLEAMAQRRIFIASDVGGHKELIEHGKTGILFKADSIDDLAAETIKLVQDRSLWPDLMENGRKFVEDVRNWENSAANYAPVYERLTKK